MKYIIFLADGAADFPIPELGNRTPLQVARKPTIDRIARAGRCGQFITVEDDMPPGSEVANLTVLGYDPKKCHQGRGVLEAAAMGVKLQDSDVAMRCNLICLEDGRIKNHSAGHISSQEAAELIRHVDRYCGCAGARFFSGVSYRHLLVLEHGSPEIECAPPHDHVGERAEDLLVQAKSEAAVPTATFLNRIIRRSWELLPDHPVNKQRAKQGKDRANSLWPWSPGRKPKMATFQELYGITGAVISAVDLIRGVGVYAGLDVIMVPGATGLIDTNYEGKADACIAALADHDFVFVHVEAADEAGHSRDLKQKIVAIEYFDSRLVNRVMAALEDRGMEATVAVLPDHPTPVATGNHVHGAVPVAICNPRWTPDSVTSYDEDSVRTGALGLLRGDAFIKTLLQK
ncbi:MAG: cofactor-independent phosphoglycerate mutase [candidate division WOR-3 bacterium]